MKFAFALYESFTLLDIIGPFQVFSSIPSAECSFLAATPGGVRDHTGVTALEATRRFDDFRDPDVIVVPGGIGTEKPIPAKHPIVDWIPAVHPKTMWTTSVCTVPGGLAAVQQARGREQQRSRAPAADSSRLDRQARRSSREGLAIPGQGCPKGPGRERGGPASAATCP